MRVIYLDVLAGVNFAMDYLLLCGTARLSGVYAPRMRLCAGAAAGACYAVLSCLPPGAWCTTLLGQIAAAMLMTRLTFGGRPWSELARLTMLFGLLSCACAGGALALGHISDVSFFAGGGFYVDVPMRVVAAAGAVCWVLSGVLFRGHAEDGIKQRQIAHVQLAFSGQTADYTLLVDSGNELSDPISGKPALVLDRRAAARVLPIAAAVPLAGLHEGNASAILAALPGDCRPRFQLLPYQAVGRKAGLLLAFRPERILREGKPWQGLAAISPEPVAGGRYEGLIGF